MSTKLVHIDDGKKVRRLQPFTNADVELQSRIIVAKNLPQDHCYQNLMKIFAVVGRNKTRSWINCIGKKVTEVEKLSQTVRQLEEAFLAGGATTNADEMNTLDRELSRAKVSANRLRDKLTVAERTTKYEAQLKEKYHLQMKVLEEGLKMSSGSIQHTNSEGKSISNGSSCRKTLSPLSYGYSTMLKHTKGTSKSFDGGSRSFDLNKALANGITFSLNRPIEETREGEAHSNLKDILEEKPNEL
ncbi:Microtubule-associated protein 70-2 [Platanthera zijinensis]|uniref:Microtubule-associated protein 70-2 n=1 Tax=Platanthera zijinensis TaxID=2320716 RepID=A0AAP0B897_9ASPA